MTTLRQIRMHHFNRATKAQASSDWHCKMAADGNNVKYHLRNAVMAAQQAAWNFSAVQALNAVVSGTVQDDITIGATKS